MSKERVSLSGLPGLRGTVAYSAALVSSSSEGCQALSMGESSCPADADGGDLSWLFFSGSRSGEDEWELGGIGWAVSSLALLAAARELSLLIWLGDFFFFLLKTFFTSTCCWSGSPRLQVKLRLALPCLHWILSVASCLDDQHWKNSINEAKTNPCSEFLSNIAAILI